MAQATMNLRHLTQSTKRPHFDDDLCSSGKRHRVQFEKHRDEGKRLPYAKLLSVPAAEKRITKVDDSPPLPSKKTSSFRLPSAPPAPPAHVASKGSACLQPGVSAPRRPGACSLLKRKPHRITIRPAPFMKEIYPPHKRQPEQ
ncbi:hypothetical protein CAPTEDRAFT_215743 [Capitella teleta]|uniref:Uncharacterized protein n=1 Tax=Capitella teleta TaxID=283909 RepID=R7VB12_CAPTE|nr:hypothetical protein CAPTEDRAFT_215743 [Capitella teleta]|eukprot:ELU15799.1 hypothetical protein CAPTEDRAFT_215743 [Capitella teleta]